MLQAPADCQNIRVIILAYAASPASNNASCPNATEVMLSDLPTMSSLKICNGSSAPAAPAAYSSGHQWLGRRRTSGRKRPARCVFHYRSDAAMRNRACASCGCKACRARHSSGCRGRETKRAVSWLNLSVSENDPQRSLQVV